MSIRSLFKAKAGVSKDKPDVTLEQFKNSVVIVDERRVRGYAAADGARERLLELICDGPPPSVNVSECRYCGAPVGILGRFLALIYTRRFLHHCNNARWKRLIGVQLGRLVDARFEMQK